MRRPLTRRGADGEHCAADRPEASKDLPTPPPVFDGRRHIPDSRDGSPVGTTGPGVQSTAEDWCGKGCSWANMRAESPSPVAAGFRTTSNLIWKLLREAEVRTRLAQAPALRRHACLQFA